MAKSKKVGEAHVDITGRLDPLKRSLIRAKTMVRNGMKSLVRIVKRAAIVFGVALGYSLYKMIRAASDAEEIQAKFNTVFKELTDNANKFAAEFAASVGRATQDVKKWMAGLQDLFVPLGMTRDAALKLDKELVKLAVDVASFNNKLDEEVIRDFTSALVGNHETIRKYGIIITETSLKQAALNAGIKKSYKELTNLEKVQLRYKAILAGSTDALGDAVRTGGSFANQMKRLKANITDFWETAGTRFLEQITAVVTKTNEWFTANSRIVAQNFGDWISNTADKLKYLAENLSLVGSFLKGMSEGIEKIGKLTPKYWIGKGVRWWFSKRILTDLAEARKETERLEALLKARGLEGVTPTTATKTTPTATAAAAKKVKTPSATFIDLVNMWKALSGGAKPTERRMLDVNEKQLQETKKQTGIMEKGFQQQQQMWSP